MLLFPEHSRNCMFIEVTMLEKNKIFGNKKKKIGKTIYLFCMQLTVLFTLIKYLGCAL